MFRKRLGAACRFMARPARGAELTRALWLVGVGWLASLAWLPASCRGARRAELSELSWAARLDQLSQLALGRAVCARRVLHNFKSFHVIAESIFAPISVC